MSIKSARGRSLARNRRNKVACVLLAILDQRNKRIIRKPNVRRDRTSVLEFIRSKDDSWFEKSYRMLRTLFYMIHDLIRPVLETRRPDMARLVWFSTAFQCTAIDCVLRSGDHPDDLHVYGVGDEAILTLMISPTFMAGSKRSTPCYCSNNV
jgi:hypothetical protein